MRSYCTACGRALVTVVEADGFSPETGNAQMTTWLQCPQFPRNWFVALFRGLHDSINAKNPILERRYR